MAIDPKDPLKLSEFNPHVSQEWVTRREFETMEHILIEREARLREALVNIGQVRIVNSTELQRIARAALEVKP